ncbi:hypothetical protein MMG00_12765 [Ignatzschineria rhizosphaerae]|uniref:DUF465 domain-containing protein n=1 Tax=Ignatzschineria rhizosphaerae TaxID=2923279 RepID=A0ABY3WZJ3_9GAMM|nr:hypothetical protein [Ignatzschineria rhizosphaerae]UNM96053.1 hypothetical protein MMG00_12765 [Ignatzschineria rhizosphaerae]
MQKLLNTIDFSKNMRKNIFLLTELTNAATEFCTVIQINRKIRAYQNEIRERMSLKPSLLIRLELRSLRSELKKLRRAVSKKTVEVLNQADLKKAA